MCYYTIIRYFFFNFMHDLFFIGQIILSAILGSILGWQREQLGKAAGLRTYALVSLGSTVFTHLSIYGFDNSDPSRVAAQIITGIGFIGAGTIIHREKGIEGLTTAAGLWATAGVGMAIGVGWYWQATLVAAVMFIIFLMTPPIQKRIFRR